MSSRTPNPSAEKHEGEVPPEDVKPVAHPDAYLAACETIGKGVKLLTEGGMGGASAGDLAFLIWKETR